MEACDLYELLEQLKEGVEDLFPERVWVRAEIASIQAKASYGRSGHCYLELCQSGPKGVIAKVRAIMWQYSYLQLSAMFRSATGSDLATGMKILAQVRINFSELYGISLIIEDLDPAYTLGDAEARRRETLDRLEKEGLLGRQKELPLSVLPYSLAVVSARDAAGFGDFSRHLIENQYGFVFKTELFEALMQGESSPASICAALRAVEESRENYDAVLLLRGGGSALDLACFDDYELCAAIARFPLPVFTAIGHDRDVHVADAVAFHSVKTPTALADLFIAAFAEEDERIVRYGSRLRQILVSRISTEEAALVRIAERIRTTNPLNVLSRGYSLVADASGVVVKKASELKPGQKVKLYFSDGALDAEISYGR